MAQRVLTMADLLIGSVSLGGYENKITLAIDQPKKDNTVFGQDQRMYTQGLMEWTISGGGFLAWHATNTESAKQLTDMMGIGTAASIITTSHSRTAGDPAYLMYGTLGENAFSIEQGEVPSFNVSINKATATHVFATRLYRATAAAGGSGTAYQVGAVTATQTMHAAMHVLAFDGTTMTMKVQSSADEAFSIPNDRITFTAATGLTSEWKTVAGAITDTWWRVLWTQTATSVLASVSIGIV